MPGTTRFHVGGTIQRLAELSDGSAVIARGATVPSDASVGYAKGCLFVDTDGAAGSVLYVNEGSATSSDFNLALADETVAFLDGVVAGTVTASKGLVVGASKELGSLGTLTFADAANIVVNATTGTKIGTATTQKLSFWNATPIVQPASANQAALSLDVDVTGGDTVDKAAINTNFTSIQTLVNQLRTDLVNAGLIKGSA